MRVDPRANVGTKSISLRMLRYVTRAVTAPKLHRRVATDVEATRGRVKMMDHVLVRSGLLVCVMRCQANDSKDRGHGS